MLAEKNYFYTDIDVFTLLSKFFKGYMPPNNLQSPELIVFLSCFKGVTLA
jgi:hypothetical protein